MRGQSLDLRGEANLLITSPDGLVVNVDPFGSQQNFSGCIQRSEIVVELPQPAQAAGVWQVRTWESFDDGGPNSVDARWATLTLTLDDGPALRAAEDGEWGEWISGGADAGDLPATAQRIEGSGPLEVISGSLANSSDVDLYVIEISDPAAFSASTVNGAIWDTQLWLFRCDGTGVSFNDDVNTVSVRQSALSSQFITEPGVYLLAISGYNRNALNEEGHLIWEDTPFEEEREPDGPGASGVLSGWVGAAQFQNWGAYEVFLTGCQRLAPGSLGCGAIGEECSPCVADQNQDDAVDDLDITRFFERFEAGDPCADVNGDDGVDDLDIGAFFSAFEQGC